MEDENDGGLSSFSLERDEEYILPALRRIWEYTGGGLALVLLNRTGAALPVTLRTGGQTARLTLPPHSLAAGTAANFR